jgi:peptidoglycan/LPS O-acetylase OafA/YrhL
LQQVVAPLCFGLVGGWLLNIALALPLTLLAAFLSWRLIEKPMLSLKGWKPAVPAW